MTRAMKIKESLSPVRKIFSERDLFLNSKISPPFLPRAKRLLVDSNINFNNVYNFNCNMVPWNIKKPHICMKLNNPNNRKIDNPFLLKQQALEHMKSHVGLLQVYTDGSKSEEGVGFAAISQRFTILSSLPSYASVFTAELFAIKNTLIYIRDNNINNIVIYTDSLSALQAIDSYSLTNPLVTEIKVLLSKSIENKFSIILCWIPSHIGLQGNEEADKNAKNSINAVCTEKKIPLKDILSYIKLKVHQNCKMLGKASLQQTNYAP